MANFTQRQNSKVLRIRETIPVEVAPREPTGCPLVFFLEVAPLESDPDAFELEELNGICVAPGAGTVEDADPELEEEPEAEPELEPGRTSAAADGATGGSRPGSPGYGWFEIVVDDPLVDGQFGGNTW